MGGQLDGKVAIVTGGAKGIGQATVELFVLEGCRVVVADIDETQGQALADNLGARARFARTDVAEEDQIQAAIDLAVRTFGGLDVMVNNAGLADADPGPLLDNRLESFRRVVDVNLLGVIVGTQRAARHMAQAGGGSVINVSSIAALTPGFGYVAYRVAKAGVVHFTKSAAIELGGDMIRVNCICPGNIPTDMAGFATPASGAPQDTGRRLREAVDTVRLRRQALKRQGAPTDVARAALFLAGDQSQQITGLVMPVDAGTSVGDAIPLLPEIMAAREAVLASAAS